MKFHAGVMNCGKNRVSRLFHRLIVPVLLLCVCASPALAEATWLQPERFAVTPGALLNVDVLDAPEFGNAAAAVRVKGLRQLIGWLGESPVMVSTAGVAGGPARAAVATLTKPGVAVLAMDTSRELLTIPRVAVESYLLAVHAPEPIVALWGEMATDADWREARFFRVKTFVRVGEPPANETPWSRQSDTGLDIVTERDPTGQSRGGELPVRVFRSGRPLAGALVTYLSKGETREHVVLTDADGRATAELDASGPWLVRATVVEAERTADHDWRTETVGLTFEVR